MTNFDRNVDLQRPGVDMPSARQSIDRNFNLRSTDVDASSNRTIQPTMTVAIVIAVLVVAAIIYSIYGFYGARTGITASAPAPSQTDTAPAAPPSKTP